MDRLRELSSRLRGAIEQRKATSPLTDGYPELTTDEAYLIQDLVVQGLGGADAAKLGLTSREKQRQMNVDSPLYGWLPAGSQIGPDEPLAIEELIQPRVEPEIAFILGEELGGTATVAHVLAATERVVPAFDVLDSRFAGYRFTLPDVIADNASAARFSLGASGASPTGLDLRLVGCVLEKNGELVSTAAGAAIMDHPAAAVAWLARALAQRGRAIPAGTIVLAGSPTSAIEVRPGDVVSAAFDRIGSLELKCL